MAVDFFPQRIVCLTEETTEWLYLLGQSHRIVGISGYTVRPKIARAEKPRVSAFTSAKIDQILALKPDCVFGFSDLQADIAATLIRHGVQVTVFNQRSVQDIFSMMYQVAAMVGEAEQGWVRIQAMQANLQQMQTVTHSFAMRPRVYFEEWDEPPISAIRWVSELIQMAGGDDCFPALSMEPMGKNRIIADPLTIVAQQPDIIFGSWCGKKFRPEKVAARPGWERVPAVRDKHIFEIKSADILQPGPAALTDGVAQLHQIIQAWVKRHG
jgi:iron complex transport system substrate-binding protein